MLLFRQYCCGVLGLLGVMMLITNYKGAHQRGLLERRFEGRDLSVADRLEQSLLRFLLLAQLGEELAR